MKVLVTGDKGFVGTYLVDYLMPDFRVFGFDLATGQDIRSYEQIRTTIEQLQPDYIYHLAGQAYVPESGMTVQRSFDVMTTGLINLLEAVRSTGCRAKILVAGTSGEYGYDVNAKVLDESVKPNPDTPYGVAKLAASHLAVWYAQRYGMHIVVTRAFNHTGPGRPSNYADSSFAKQVVQAERGLIKEVKHGNLESVRNFTDVRDMVKAYRLAIELPSDVYNICSDQNVTMQQIMDIFVKNAEKPVDTRVDESLYRPSTLTYINPSCAKFTKLTNWKPEIKLEQTLQDLLTYWRENL